jgi:hypothetical protein
MQFETVMNCQSQMHCSRAINRFIYCRIMTLATQRFFASVREQRMDLEALLFAAPKKHTAQEKHKYPPRCDHAIHPGVIFTE